MLGSSYFRIVQLFWSILKLESPLGPRIFPSLQMWCCAAVSWPPVVGQRSGNRHWDWWRRPWVNGCGQIPRFTTPASARCHCGGPGPWSFWRGCCGLTWRQIALPWTAPWVVWYVEINGGWQCKWWKRWNQCEFEQISSLSTPCWMLLGGTN